MLLRDLALNAPDPALSSNFMCRVPMADYTREVMCEKVTPTFIKTPAQPRFNGGSNSYYPGVSDIDGISITFYETHDYLVSAWLKRWQKLVFDPDTGYYGLPSVYKKVINIIYFQPGATLVAKEDDYLGCWPTDKGPFNLDYSSENDRITVEAQFSVDSVNPRR